MFKQNIPAFITVLTIGGAAFVIILAAVVWRMIPADFAWGWGLHPAPVPRPAAVVPLRPILPIYAEAGEWVCCESGHLICQFREDAFFGRLVDYSLFIKWTQPVPAFGSHPTCATCGKRWWSYGDAFHFADGWRHGPKRHPELKLNLARAKDRVQISSLLQRTENMALDLARLKAAAEAETTVVASCTALLQNLATQVGELRKQVPPDAQATIDSIAQALEMGHAGLVAAITANTIADPKEPWNRHAQGAEMTVSEARSHRDEDQSAPEPEPRASQGVGGPQTNTGPQDPNVMADTPTPTPTPLVEGTDPEPQSPEEAEVQAEHDAVLAGAAAQPQAEGGDAEPAAEPVPSQGLPTETVEPVAKSAEPA